MLLLDIWNKYVIITYYNLKEYRIQNFTKIVCKKINVCRYLGITPLRYSPVKVIRLYYH